MSNIEEKPTPAKHSVGTVRSKSFYLQNVVIQVENELFCLPKSLLSRYSDVFEGMFMHDDPHEGRDDANPIVLEGYKNDDFTALLKVLIPEPRLSYPPPLTKTEWTSVLKLSTIWQMKEIRTDAIDQLSKMSLEPFEKIHLAREHRVSKWFLEGACTLAKDFKKYNVAEVAATIGWETTARILSVRLTVDTSEYGRVVNTAGTRCGYCKNGIHPRGNLLLCDSCSYVGYGIEFPTDVIFKSVDSVQSGTISPLSNQLSAVFADEIKSLDA